MSCMNLSHLMRHSNDSSFTFAWNIKFSQLHSSHFQQFAELKYLLLYWMIFLSYFRTKFSKAYPDATVMIKHQKVKVNLYLTPNSSSLSCSSLSYQSSSYNSPIQGRAHLLPLFISSPGLGICFSNWTHF